MFIQSETIANYKIATSDLSMDILILTVFIEEKLVGYFFFEPEKMLTANKLHKNCVVTIWKVYENYISLGSVVT